MPVLGRIEMKLSERIYAQAEYKLLMGWDKQRQIAEEVAQLEAENEELRELFVYFFGENYEELGEQDA